MPVTGTAVLNRSEDEKDWHDALYPLLRRQNVPRPDDVPDAGHQVLIDRSLTDRKPALWR
jgi:hypothetical protein